MLLILGTLFMSLCMLACMAGSCMPRGIRAADQDAELLHALHHPFTACHQLLYDELAICHMMSDP